MNFNIFLIFWLEIRVFKFITTIVLYFYPDVCKQTVYDNEVARVQEKRKISKSTYSIYYAKRQSTQNHNSYVKIFNLKTFYLDESTCPVRVVII